MLIKYIVLLVGLILSFSCRSDSSKIKKQKLQDGQSLSDIIHTPIGQDGQLDTVNVAKISFEENIYYFGTALAGDIVNHTFYFINEGKKPLLIKDARSTCGCTVPTFPKEVIAVGQRDSVVVKFNTTNKIGFQNKAVSLIANTYPNKTVVYLRGKVKLKE